MSFTNLFFLFGLFPIFIIVYYILNHKKTLQLILLGVANTIFYIWSGAWAFLIVLALAFITWFFSKLCYKKIFFILGICLINFPLLYIKFSGFFLEKLGVCINSSGMGNDNITLLGISFITFESVSCICDVRNKKTGHLSFGTVFLYLFFFPTVVSGPIMRINDFIKHSSGSVLELKYNEGMRRFFTGLCKKNLLADKIAPLADYFFNGVANGGSYSIVGLWIGSVAYTMQLYFDFSGYSDMAIGIGKILGFEIPENFRQPYQAKSIHDFWKRWHITLSTWFRDYIYIPLGGSRKSTAVYIRNMLIVWMLTGIWHGTGWTFIIWGVAYFVLLIIEKYIPVMQKIGSKWYGRIYTMFFVNLLWIPFRADSFDTMMRYLKGMIGLSEHVAIENIVYEMSPILFMAVLICNLPVENMRKTISEHRVVRGMRDFLFLCFIFLAICALLNRTYTPYIYGSF